MLGTANVMMAAVLAEGVTVIESAACEPEVVDLANFLNAMGAQISGAGSPTITITGVKELHGAEHEVIPDRIEAATYAIAAAATNGEITLRGARAGPHARRAGQAARGRRRASSGAARASPSAATAGSSRWISPRCLTPVSPPTCRRR